MARFSINPTCGQENGVGGEEEMELNDNDMT